MWMSADEALRRLGVKPQTLYASVSRGRIRAKPDPADSRKSLYSGDDVDRLARRSAGRPRTEAVAAEAIRWGDPVLDSAISTVAGGRLIYRGKDAVELAESASLEDIAQLLWQTASVPNLVGEGLAMGEDRTAFGLLLVALARRAAVDAPSYGRSTKALHADAGATLALIADATCGPGAGPVHQRLAARWGKPDAADAIRRALVLLADHELNASTFAARVAVSTGASLAAGALAGLATLTGPLHGSASVAALSLGRQAAEIGAEPALRSLIGEGRRVPAFGHPLYPKGDVRAVALLESLVLTPPYITLMSAADMLIGEAPNVDFALAALAATHHLPDTAPLQLFALARSVGWLAHMLEQHAAGVLIRPRARYVGETAPAG